MRGWILLSQLLLGAALVLLSPSEAGQLLTSPWLGKGVPRVSPELLWGTRGQEELCWWELSPPKEKGEMLPRHLGLARGDWHPQGFRARCLSLSENQGKEWKRGSGLAQPGWLPVEVGSVLCLLRTPWFKKLPEQPQSWGWGV